MNRHFDPLRSLHFTYRTEKELQRIKMMLVVLDDYPAVQLRQPTPANPWHWRAEYAGGKYPDAVDFWPHKAKSRRNGPTETTLPGFDRLLSAMILESE